jgi:hypothetical protein
MKVKAMWMLAWFKISGGRGLRKKITVTTLNLSIEALVWKLKTFYLSASRLRILWKTPLTKT